MNSATCQERAEVRRFLPEVRTQATNFGLVLRVREASQYDHTDVGQDRVPAEGSQNLHAVMLRKIKVQNDDTGLRGRAHKAHRAD